MKINFLIFLEVNVKIKSKIIKDHGMRFINIVFRINYIIYKIKPHGIITFLDLKKFKKNKKMKKLRRNKKLNYIRANLIFKTL